MNTVPPSATRDSNDPTPPEHFTTASKSAWLIGYWKERALKAEATPSHERRIQEWPCRECGKTKHLCGDGKCAPRANVAPLPPANIPLVEALCEPCMGCGKRPFDFLEGNETPSSTRALEEELEQANADLKETMQILGEALAPGGGLHIGDVPSMARDVVAKLSATGERMIRVPPEGCKALSFRISVNCSAWSCDCGASTISPECRRRSESRGANG